jgi:hypothetical protein
MIGVIVYAKSFDQYFSTDYMDIDWKETPYTLALEIDESGRTTQNLYFVNNAAHHTKNPSVTRERDDDNANEDEDVHISLCSMHPPFTIAKFEFPWTSLFIPQTYTQRIELNKLSDSMPKIDETAIIEKNTDHVRVGLVCD